MNLGVHLPISPPSHKELIAVATTAEEAGFDSIWSSEAYGADAVSTLAWAAAHTSRVRIGTSVMQMPARTPATTAMTAMSLDLLSNGRFVLGLGASGPSVVEGWHGVPFGRPLERTREYVALLRTAMRRDKLAGGGANYRVPFDGPGATGLGRPLRSTLPACPDIPVYLAATGPKNVALSLEIADGLLPVFFNPLRCTEVYGAALATRVAEGFAVAPTVWIALGDDVAACRDRIRPHAAFYIGGMGPRGKNFYNDLVRRYGYDEVATKVQDLFLDGKHAEAAAAVPDALIDEIALVGPDDRVREQLRAWANAPVTTLLLETADLATIRRIAAIDASR
jgi:F420-dependent oxidoreductase-like protein